MTLEVRISNDSAQNLYFKYGFKSLGVRRNYYQDNDEDAMVLWTENISTPDFDEMLKGRVVELEKLESDQVASPAANGANGNGGPNESHQTRRLGD